MTDTHAFNDARRLCAHLRCRRYCISVAAMWVVVFHPQRQQFEKIIVESSKETVDALVERQQKHVKLGIEGHRQAMRQKQEAENLLQSLRSPRLPQAVARTAEPVQAPAALTVGADGIAAVGTVVESTASSTDVVGTTVMFIGRFCGADAKELRAAARRKGMVIRTNTFRVDHAVVGTVSIKSTRLELALASGARRLSADEFKALLAKAPDVDKVETAVDDVSIGAQDPGAGSDSATIEGGSHDEDSSRDNGTSLVDVPCQSDHFWPGVFPSTRATAWKRATTFTKQIDADKIVQEETEALVAFLRARCRVGDANEMRLSAAIYMVCVFHAVMRSQRAHDPFAALIFYSCAESHTIYGWRRITYNVSSSRTIQRRWCATGLLGQTDTGRSSSTSWPQMGI